MPIAYQYLLKFPLLQDLPLETLMRLSTQMTERDFARREVVSTKEQTQFALGFLLAGRLQGVDYTVDGRAVGLYFVEPGAYFGELSVVDGQQAAEHVIAVVKSRAVFLDLAAARVLIFQQPTIAQAVMSRLSQRVRNVTAQRTLLALSNPFQRLCAQVLQLSQVGSQEVRTLDPVPTHQELAIMINASRETVTRAFQILFLNEVLTREGNTLTVLREDYLSDIAEGRLDPPKA
jgi:CRP-like cAMP-binding protein